MKRQRKTRKMRGGRLTWGFGNLGTGWNQFMTLQPNPSPNTIPLGIKKGGKRIKKGGNIGVALGQAVVPGALIALNQSTKKRRRNHLKT
jgi:hypothetical protein